MRAILSLYSLKLPLYFVYMLQQVEYEPAKFYAWFTRNVQEDKSFKQVMHRKQLVYSARAKLLLLSSYALALLLLGSNFLFLVTDSSLSYLIFGLVSDIIFMPFILLIILRVLATFAYYLIVLPEQKRLVAHAEQVFAEHKGIKIAVLGSYGKTTMKELLATVLSEGKRVAATPGNMNVSVSHARFANKLSGDEEVVVVEFGEGAPGDIERMAKMLRPDYAVITGLAPNHLDHYDSLDSVAKDLLSIYDVVEPKNVFVTNESPLLKNYLQDEWIKFSRSSVLGWSVQVTDVAVNSLSFSMTKKKQVLHLKSELVGAHQVAPLALVAAIASQIGLSDAQIVDGVAKTKPYEHRLQPRQINGAWLIDDTYNGNLEGIQAGLAFLATVDAKRKWYVTPGLVDQGTEMENVHQQLGSAICDANPDIVVLMENSVRPIVEEALKFGKFKGELRIEQDPLTFYTNIEHVVAAGDVVLMQNDWTDNYS